MSRKVPPQSTPHVDEYVIDYDAITYGDAKIIRRYFERMTADDANASERMDMLEAAEQVVMKYISGVDDVEQMPSVVIQRATLAVLERLTYQKSLGK